MLSSKEIRMSVFEMRLLNNPVYPKRINFRLYTGSFGAYRHVNTFYLLYVKHWVLTALYYVTLSSAEIENRFI